MTGALARAFAVRPGEARSLLLVAGAFAAAEGGRAMGEVGVNTIIVSRLGADVLPALYVGLGLFTMALSIVFAATLARAVSRHYYPALLGTLAAIIGLQWLLVTGGIEAAYPLVWVVVYGSGLVLLMVMWSVSGLAFDTRQAKRLFPLVASAAVAGNLCGLIAAIVLERIIGAAAIILAESCLLLLAAVLISGTGVLVRPRRATGTVRPSWPAAASAGARYVAGSRLMRLLSLVFLLLTLTQYATIFGFMSAMGAAFTSEQSLLTALAVIAAFVTISSFLFGTLVANRLFDRLGVPAVLIGLPVMYVAGFGIWLLRYDLVSAVIVRFGQQFSRHGFGSAALRAFFNVVPAGIRGQALAFVDGVPGQVGTMLAGLLLIVTTSLSMELVFWVGLIAAVASLVVVRRVPAAYAETVLQTLRETRSEQFLEGGPGLAAMTGDARVADELLAATHSATPSERVLAADLLGRIGAARTTDDLRRLTTDGHAEVRRIALESLVRIVGPGAVEDVRRASTDDDPTVRAGAVAVAGTAAALPAGDRLLRALERDPDPRVRGELVALYSRRGEDDAARRLCDAMLASADTVERAAGLTALARTRRGLDAESARRFLDDPDGDVRAAAIYALATTSGAGLDLLVDALDDPDQAVRAAASEALREHDDAPPRLVAVLAHGSDRACHGALTALAGRTDAVRPALLDWAERQVDRSMDLRRYRVAFATAEPGSAAEYLGAVVRMREDALQAQLLHAIAAMGTPEASGVVRRSLGSPDRDTRAQAVETLDVLVDPRLSRRLVRLLESQATDAGTADLGPREAARELGRDPDPWVRALALRTLGRDDETIAESHAPLATPRLGASVPSSRPPQEDPDVTSERLQLVSDLDRMLALRRVPLFTSLAPEDLQRIATAARVATWAAGDVLMAQGDIGSELVVIVEGSVSIFLDEGGSRRFVRTCLAGDHIGELAVLRDAPRSASVIADAGGVLGLVLDGEAFRALVLERPRAAMALLATLAERVSH